MMNRIIPNLWFNNCAKEAVNYYVSVFPVGKILSKDFYTDYGEEITGHKKDELVTVEFKIMNTRMIAINAGSEFAFNPSISMMILCKDQQEIDYYWEKLSSSKADEQCGWAKDKYGLTWQIVPKKLGNMMQTGNEEQRKRVTEAFMNMKKIEISKLEEAYKGSKK